MYNFAVTHNALMDLSYYMDGFNIDKKDIYPDVYDTTNKKVNLTAPGTVDAIEDLLSAYQSGFINLTGGASDAFINKEPVFRQGVFLQTGSYGKEYDMNYIDWDMIHVPLANTVGNSAFGSGSLGVGVYNRTRNPNAVAAFALFFYTQEGQTAFNSQNGGSVPVLKSLRNADFWQHTDNTENGWNEKNWAANVYKSDAFAVKGQLQSILPPAVADTFELAWSDRMQDVLRGDVSILFISPQNYRLILSFDEFR